MTRRIVNADLEALVSRINSVTGSPSESYTKDEAGKFTSNLDNYHLSWAYGGVTLHRMCTTGGGVNEIFAGHMPKRELYNKMSAFLAGIDAVS